MRLLGNAGTTRLSKSRGDRHRVSTPPDPNAPYQAPLSADAPAIVAPRVLIIAELTLPQCGKYRVWQKQEMLQALGLSCTVVNWHDIRRARSRLQTHALVIFYRVPGMPNVMELFEETQRLALPSFWEVDDLIFDRQIFSGNRNVAMLDRELRDGLLSGVTFYRKAMLACDRAIASTAVLADTMRAAGVRDACVIENALDSETLEAAAAIRARRHRAEDGTVIVTYGSGTKTHDADFLVAAPALTQLLRENEQVRLRVVGYLNLPSTFDEFGARVERLPGMDYRNWLELLGDSDISLAPLEATLFNDAKSNIKFLEAAVLGVPSVCSARTTFRTAITHGENGFLADFEQDWMDALKLLVGDAERRARVGAAALATVNARYSPAAVARAQVAPLVAGLDRRPPRAALRVLVVNVLFWPRSFGGATIVAEEMARRLNARADTEVFVFTTQARDFDPSGTVVRYECDGIQIFGVKAPPGDSILDFDNPEMAEIFADVVDAVEPDIVHFHSIQSLGAAIMGACQDRRIPYVVTLHDAWWLCDRQFMVRADGRYCFQTRIDLKVCVACVPGASHLQERWHMLHSMLQGADLLLAPSEFQRRLYIANGFMPERVAVNRNGIRLPQTPRHRQAGPVLRIGYVGGNVVVKGFPLLREALEQLPHDNYELVLVDNTMNVGLRSLDVSTWRLAGKVTVVPAYVQDELDGFFGSLDVLVFPSQWKESFGLTVREALARDVWVIATDGGGTSEDIVDGVNGTIIPLDGRSEGLQAALAALLDNPGKLAEHVNPYKARLIDFAAQAEELHAQLSATRDAAAAPDLARVPLTHQTAAEPLMDRSTGRGWRSPSPAPGNDVTTEA